jgi:predicted nucleic acid-binding protein
MILLDTDVMIDLLRQYPPAVTWFDTSAICQVPGT